MKAFLFTTGDLLLPKFDGAKLLITSLDGKVTKDQDYISFTSKLQLKKQTQPEPSRNKLLCIYLSSRRRDSRIAHYNVNLNIVRIVF